MDKKGTYRTPKRKFLFFPYLEQSPERKDGLFQIRLAEGKSLEKGENNRFVSGNIHI